MSNVIVVRITLDGGQLAFEIKWLLTHGRFEDVVIAVGVYM